MDKKDADEKQLKPEELERKAIVDTETETDGLDLQKEPDRTVPRSETQSPSLEECFYELKVQTNPIAISSSEETLQFVQNYRKQYGEPILDFIVADLKSAYEVACNQLPDEKKLLAIYLHHCDSILTNTFCNQVLKNDEVLTTFNNLFIVFGWDVSRKTHANYFHDQLRDIISDEAAEAAKNLKLDQMPTFLIIGHSTGGKIPNVGVIYGDYDDDSLQTRLQLEYSLLSGLYE